MNKITIAAATALTALGAFATPAAAQTWSHNNGGYDNDRDRRDDDRRGDNYRRGDNDRGQWNNYNRYDRFDRRGYRNWRRGERMSAYDMRRYRAIDYRRHHLRTPPRGYRYIQDDRGETLLVGIATGVILSILLNQ